jgi:hypothetical protein
MKEYFSNFKDQSFRRSLSISIILLVISLFINFYAGVYATERASNSVTDIILSNIPVLDVDGVFIYGSWLLAIFITYLCIRRPNQTPFILKSISLFILIRDVFITLTHIGPFPTQITIDPKSFINYFVFGGDLFFSGHTGLPFLLALIFWENKRLRLIFLGSSIAFAVIVLLGHLHYTIDVLSAFFISFGIYHLSRKWFRNDLARFSGISTEKIQN